MPAGVNVAKSYEIKRNENLQSIDSEARKRIIDIDGRVNIQKQEIENGTMARITELNAQKGQLISAIGSLESTLANLPINHPQKKDLESQLKMYKVRREQIDMSIITLRARAQSQTRTASFMAKMQKENIKITFGRQKGMVLMRFAEIISQSRMQEAQARAQQTNLARTGSRNAPDQKEMGKQGA